jgi:dTDP-4-amino-4,6-dideoxygalactose transaminase
MKPSGSAYIPFGRPNYTNAEIQAATSVLKSGWVGMGPETIAFERELARYVKAPQLVAVNSCTSALFLSLAIHGIGPGDEVICPSLTWCSTANAALYLGARPVFCDVDPKSLCATPETVARLLTRRTRAVIVVHFGGHAIDVASLRRSLPAKVAIIEDAAHALGAYYPQGEPVGSSGNLVCFSFYPNKNLATAEGGAIALADAAAANRLRSLRQHALPINAWKRFTERKSLLFSNQLVELGYKMNFTDLQAAIARVQLRRQPVLVSRRLAIARTYARRLARMRPNLAFQAGFTGDAHARHLAAVILDGQMSARARDCLIRDLRSKNIGATVHYTPLHTMPLYGKRPRPLPVTESIYPRLLSLPISSSMTVADAEYVCDELVGLLETRPST